MVNKLRKNFKKDERIICKNNSFGLVELTIDNVYICLCDEYLFDGKYLVKILNDGGNIESYISSRFILEKTTKSVDWLKITSDISNV